MANHSVMTMKQCASDLQGLCSKVCRSAQHSGPLYCAASLYVQGQDHVDVIASSFDGCHRSPGNTIFSSASISKIIVGVAIMQCTEKGLVDLHGDISKYLPFTFRNPRYPNDPISVYMLLTHTSSLVDSESALMKGSRFRVDGGVPNPWSLLDYTKLLISEESSNKWSKLNPPGKVKNYSNAGFTVLGFAVELLRGKPFHQTVKERIFQPLGMIHSSFTLEEAKRLAKKEGDIMICRPGNYDYYEVAEYPAAQLRSTCVDLRRFLSHLCLTRQGEKSEIISTASVLEMMPNEKTNCLAWWGVDFPYHSQSSCWEHGGFMQGIRSYAFVWESGCMCILFNGEIACFEEYVTEFMKILNPNTT